MTRRTGQKGHGVDATLAAIATLTAAWPVSTLLAEPAWLGGTVLLLTVIALSGVGSRWLGLRGWQVLMVQLLCAVLAAGAFYGRGHLWHGMPTFDTLELAGSLVREALVTVNSYAAPVPATPGLSFVVGCALGLIALAVDYLAVTRRSPSLAGLPLLTAFLAAAANSGSTMPVIFFVATAAMWLVLVARSGSTILRRWGTNVAVARTPAPPSLESQGLYEYASTARLLGALALVAAVSLPIVLPQLPPTFLASGLGRSSSETGGGSGTVGFSLSLDLAADLKSQNTAPVLQYRTNDPSPPPLRVGVSSFYDSGQGIWIPVRGRLPALSTNPVVPAPTGLSTDVPKKPFTMTVDLNLLEEPNLAAPYPLISADLDGVSWGQDEQTRDVKVFRRPDSYALSYWRLEPTATMLRSASGNPDLPGVAFDNDLTTDPSSIEIVAALTERLTAGKTSAYDKAMAIQQNLRATGGFTYSLTLAPPLPDRSFGRAGFDPLTNFLVTKQGYCVQFATAMVMMSRAAGIPARMAIGFLPGTEAEGVWTVRAPEAHTWPELYLDGIGWTRFEPTPSRGTLPGYAVPPSSAGTPAGENPLDESAPAPTSITGPDLDSLPGGQSANPDAAISLTSVLRWLTQGWGPVLLGSVALLLGSMVVPMAARWRRRKGLAAARTAAQRVEVHWEHLTSSLDDLGIEPAPSRTPRQLRVHYEREAFLEGAAAKALGRVVQTLERSRYASSAPAPDRLPEDVRQVLRAAAVNRRRNDRIRAVLWPSGGIAQLRSAGADVAWRVRAPLREVSTVVRQRLRQRLR